MEKVLRVFVKERTITKEDGSVVKPLETSYTPDGKKFYKIIFTGVSKPNRIGYWLVKVDSSKVSPKDGKPLFKKDGTPVISKKTGQQVIENDLLFIKEVISLKFDENYEEERAKVQQEKVDAIFSLDGDNEPLPFE